MKRFKETELPDGWGRVDVVMKSGEVWRLKYMREEYAPMMRKLCIPVDNPGAKILSKFRDFLGIDGDAVFLNIEEIEGFQIVDVD